MVKPVINDGADEGYLNWASSRPPRDDPQMEKPMAMTPFQKPSSLAVMWWSNRNRGNMVTAPCSPAYTVIVDRGGQEEEVQMNDELKWVKGQGDGIGVVGYNEYKTHYLPYTSD